MTETRLTERDARRPRAPPTCRSRTSTSPRALGGATSWAGSRWSAPTVVAVAGSVLLVSAARRSALHDLGAGPVPVLRAAGEDGRPLRPRPVRPAQDDARRGPALLAGRGDLRARHRGRAGDPVHGRSQPLLLWGMLTAALRRRAGAGALRDRAGARRRSGCSWSATPRQRRAHRAQARRRPGAQRRRRRPCVARGRPTPTPRRRARGLARRAPAVIEHAPRSSASSSRRRSEGGDDVVDVIRLGTACGVRVAVLPRLLEVIGTSVEFDDLGGQALLGVRGFGLSPSSRLLKRMLDLVVACLALVRAAPFLLADRRRRAGSARPGPILFRQTRVGRDGGEFQMLKFRTMVDGRRRAQARAARAQRGRAAVQDRRRPARDAASAASCAATRSTSCPQLFNVAARRHEHRRPAPAGRRGGPPLLGLAAAPLPRRPGHHRAVADPRLEPGAGQRHGDARLPLLRELVAVARREDHGPHDPLRPQPAQRRVHGAAARDAIGDTLGGPRSARRRPDRCAVAPGTRGRRSA